MQITYADKQRWLKNINPDIFPDFGKNNTKKLQSLFSFLNESEINYTVDLMAEVDVYQFESLYQKNLMNKHNPKPHNIHQTTLGKDVIKFPYYILSLFEGKKMLGGTIFTLRDDRLSIAYRTYQSTWDFATHKCSPALYAEYLITSVALEKGYTKLAHGIDFNPYGINSHIGVAIFKLSVGCCPDIETTHIHSEIDLDTLPYGSLILEYPKTNKKITRAYLVGDSSTAEKYEQVFKYPKQLEVTLYTPTV